MIQDRANTKRLIAKVAGSKFALRPEEFALFDDWRELLRPVTEIENVSGPKIWDREGSLLRCDLPASKIILWPDVGSAPAFAAGFVSWSGLVSRAPPWLCQNTRLRSEIFQGFMVALAVG